MTLNLTLLSRWGIHQSADFRLLDADLKKLVSDHSPKLLQVVYEDWVGNITYCGIGRWRNVDTSQWLKGWLSHDFGENRSFEEIIELISQEGSQWIKDISHFAKKVPTHTFIVTSLIQGKPTIALISNNQRLDSPELYTETTHLDNSIATIHRRRLVVTGVPLAISDQDASLLESFGRSSVDTEHVQRVFAQVNAKAAISSEARNAISEACWVYSILADGTSRGRLFGDVEGELVPITLFQGMDILDQINLITAPGREIQMTGSTFVTSQALSQKKHIKCNPRVIVHKDQPASRMIIMDVGDLGGATTRVHAVNEHSVATGESFLSPSGPSHAFIWKEDVLSDIGTLGGASSIAKDINDRGQIIGASVNATGDNHVFLWSTECGMQDLGTLGGRHSNAAAISNLGAIVGSSWTLPGDNPRDPQERAFLCNKAEGMQSIGSLGGSWSRAYDINDREEIVGISLVGGFTHAFFRQSDGTLLDIGTLGGDSCEALALNNTGEVVGMSETGEGLYRPFIWSIDLGMREIEIPGKVFVRDIDDDGYIIGDLELDIGKRSFIYCFDRGLRFLPWYEHHRSEALGIANGPLICGQIIGIEMHCHGIIWSPNKN